MKSKRWMFRPVAIFLVMSGCASFQPKLQQQDFIAARQPSVSEVKDGLSTSVEEFATPNKSRMAFDADIARDGVLALLIRVENKGSHNYRIQPNDITAFLGDQHLSALPGDKAASKAATSEYVGKALGWTLATGPFAIVLWPGTIAGSASHTAYINRRIKRHFQSLEFKEAVVKPNETATGFMYFDIPEKSKRLENLVVQVDVLTDQGGKVSYKLSVPPVDLSKEN